ncbi:unnamed protein product [Psylliodes chrysocephalus]|uniref:Ketimine reductase mu-crystallin n=1 Tax=Psylliodes chrysocephalus TaxID=3402493 RepID=A0A9P0CHL8_9CUCU|nr:unnamed protein product [Psylliodes chrysocephala]
MIYIDEDMVLKLINWDQTFEAMEVAMQRYTENRIVQTARSRTQVIGKPNLLVTMPGYLDDQTYGALGCKLVTFFPTNSDLPKPLPSVLASIMLFDENTGLPKACVGGFEITKWRTSAASAVATRHIYEKRFKPLNILALLGAGHQGRTHADCFKHFFNFQEIRVWNRTASKAKEMVEEFNKKYNTNIFKFYESNEKCVRGADVIVTTTNTSEPIVNRDWVKPGAHINSVGAGRNHHSEIEESLYFNADVYIDHWEGAKTELAGLEKIGIQFKAEVGKVILNQVKTEDPNRITIFQSLGMAVEDCAMSRLIYDSYLKTKNK